MWRGSIEDTVSGPSESGLVRKHWVEEVPARLEGLADEHVAQAVLRAAPQAQRVAGEEAERLAAARQADVQRLVVAPGQAAHEFGDLVGRGPVVVGRADVGQRPAGVVVQDVDVRGAEGDRGEVVVAQEAREPAGLIRQQREPRALGTFGGGEQVQLRRHDAPGRADQPEEGFRHHLRVEAGDDEQRGVHAGGAGRRWMREHRACHRPAPPPEAASLPPRGLEPCGEPHGSRGGRPRVTAQRRGHGRARAELAAVPAADRRQPAMADRCRRGRITSGSRPRVSAPASTRCHASGGSASAPVGSDIAAD